MNKHMAGVSVVIPAYKATATIQRAVNSCLLDGAIGEVVVVLDGLDDGLEKAVPKEKIVTLIKLDRNGGASAARNVGFGAAQGEFVIFLDADDYVEGSLASALQRAGRKYAADIVFGPFAYEWPSGARHQVDVVATFGEKGPAGILKCWLRGIFVPTCAVLWRSSLLRKINGWDEGLIKNQDGDLIFRALLAGASVAFAADGLGIYVQHETTHRVSTLTSEASFRSLLEILKRLEVGMKQSHLREGLPELADAYYSVARGAYYHHYSTIGRAAEEAASRLGVRASVGTALHKSVANTIGLRRKEEFSAWIHEMLSILRLRR
jgi:glycosyltransferase involved in cell wall biosynthesis